jgi:hypothetical protein
MPDPATERKRGRRAARAFAIALSILLALVILPLLALLAVNSLDARDPDSFLPAKPDAFASVPSLADAVTRLTGLRAVDELLAGPGEAGLRSLLVSARSFPFLSSPAFRFLASVPVHVAVEGDEVVAAVDLRLLGVGARLLPLAAPLAGPLFKIKDFSFERVDGISRILVGSGSSALRLAVVGKILIASTSAPALERALARGRAGEAKGAAVTTEASLAPNLAVRARLAGLELSAPGGAIRLIVDSSALASRLGLSGAAASILGDLKFPEAALIDLDLSDERISLEARLPVKSDKPDLAALLARRPGSPSILALLPSSTSYASLAALGRPTELLAASSPYLGAEAQDAYKKAEAACKAALGVGFDELLYSWAGDEFGAFGLDAYPEPVFYVQVADEAARKSAFAKLAASMLVDEDLSTVVDGLRVPRLILPPYVKNFLSLVGVSVPQPYWIEERGFLFASASAEALRAVAKTAASGESLPRAPAFKALLGPAGSDAGAAVYYSLDRGLPFFIRGSSPVERVLRLYRTGILLLRGGGGSLRLSLLAVRGEARSGLRELPGFPVAAGGRLAGPPLVLGSGSGAVLVLPLEGNRLLARPLSGSPPAELKLDAAAELLAAKGPKGEGILWALTRQGTIYRLDSRLEQLRPFPYTALSRPSSGPSLAPAAVPGGEAGIAFGAKGGGFVIVGADGSERRVELPGENPLLSPPSFSGGLAAAYPKAFDGRLYLLDSLGSPLPGWPLPAGGIAYGSPLLMPNGGASTGASASGGALVAFLTQAGELTLRDSAGALLPGFPLRLGGSFMKAPAASTDGASVYLIDAEGLILRVSASGEVLAQRREDSLRGGEASILVARDQAAGGDWIFAAGAGNSLYAYTASLDPLPGFPAKGAWLPALADLDGDGFPEIVTGGLDDQVHAYSAH